MMRHKTVLLCLLIGCRLKLSAQTSDAFTLLNQHRIQTNKTGMQVLGTWGAANIVSGVVGYNVAKDNEWRSFYQMNVLWGVVNLGIAAAGYAGTRKEARQSFMYGDALQRHEANKKLFLLNAGLDGLYIGTGLFLTEHAKNETNHPEVWRGYGKSILVQGVGLLLFDAVMFSAHNSKDRHWYRILEGINIRGNGVGFNYRF